MLSAKVNLLPRPFSWILGSVEPHVQAACWSPVLRSSAASHTPSPFVHELQSSRGKGYGQASPPSGAKQVLMLAIANDEQ